MVKIVTDSTSDIPLEVAQALGIIIVPAYVHFGNQIYRDGVDIGPDELYQRMIEGPVHPTTSAPSPGDFAQAYNRLAQDSDEIVSIVVTSKHSAIYDSALVGKESVKRECRIEVIDSQSASIGLGLIAIAAAKTAQLGGSIDDVVRAVHDTIPRTRVLALLDTLKYALKGGRLGKAGMLMGAMVKVKPMLTAKDGMIRPVGVVRTRAKGIEKLCEFVRKHLPVEDLAVAHSTSPQEAAGLADRIRSFVPQTRPLLARLGSALGVHGGPGALGVALIRQGGATAEKAVEKERRGRRISLPSLRFPH